jgi:glucose/arabinose dehydrogenase
VYVSYTFNKLGDCDAEYTSTPVGRISRFQLNDNSTIDPASERVIIDNVPSVIGVHNVADVEFGKDGYLYISIGDSGCDYAADSGCFDSNNAAQDLHSLV